MNAFYFLKPHYSHFQMHSELHYFKKGGGFLYRDNSHAQTRADFHTNFKIKAHNLIIHISSAQGDFKKAEGTYLEAILTLEKALGPNHIEVAEVRFLYINISRLFSFFLQMAKEN